MLYRCLFLSFIVTTVLLSGPILAAEYTAKIGHLESPEQPRHRGLEKVAALVAERTNGEVELQLFPARQLGNAREMNEGVQLGSIEGTVSPAAFLGGFNPAVSILDIPYLLPADRAQAKTLRQGPLGQAVLDSFSERGFVAIALWPNGRKSFTSSKALADLAAFQGQRFRVMDSKILIEQFNALGASAVALPFGELYTALSTGVVDGQENPLDTIEKMKFYEVQDYLVLSEHGALEDVVLFNPTWWNALPEDYQNIIRDTFASNAIIDEVEANKEADQQAALETIKQAGLGVRELSVDERAALREQMYPAARQAYLDSAGAAGEALIQLYEQEYSKLTGNQ